MRHTTFEEFTEKVVAEIKNFLPSGYADATVSVQKIAKPGGRTLTGIVIHKTDCTTAPVIYLNNAYHGYCDGLSFRSILTELAQKIYCNGSWSIDVQPFLEWKTAKDYVTSRFINIDRNRDYIANRQVNMINSSSDIGIIYDIDLSHISNKNRTIPITFALMKQWKISLSELDAAAKANNPRINPVIIRSIGQTISDLSGDETGQFVDIPELFFVVTNEQRCQGAIAITYEGVEQQLKKMLGDFYILPSSVHEVLVMSRSMAELDMLREMIQDINGTEVAVDEVLADVPYVLENGCLIPAFETESGSGGIPDGIPENVFAN